MAKCTFTGSFLTVKPRMSITGMVESSMKKAPTKLVRSIKCFKDCKFNNPVALNENLGYFKGSKCVQFKMEEAK